MENSVRTRAKSQALEDWQNKCAVHLFHGYLDPKRPSILKGQVFYPKFKNVMNDEDEEFCQVYNQTIDELLKLEGVPDWAPVRKIPEKERILRTFRTQGQKLSEYRYASVKERNVFQSVVSKWSNNSPCMWCRIPDRQILLIGGDLTPKLSRVDIIDTENMRWLSTAELSRNYYPSMPWDNIEARNNCPGQ